MFKYAEVILPLPLNSTFTYAVPEEMCDKISHGSRVLVPFGKKKFYTAIVYSLHNISPEGYDVKKILDFLDEYSILKYPQLKLWTWISEYYLCSLGDVYKAAIPAGLKIESETYVSINPEFEATEQDTLKERELVVLDCVASRDKVQINEIAKATGYKNVESIVMRLVDKEALFVSESLQRTYRPKTETYITLCCSPGDEESLHRYFDLVKSAKKQEQLLLAFLDLSHWLNDSKRKEVSKQELLDRVSVGSGILKATIDKGIFKVYKKEINRFRLSYNKEIQLPELTAVQKQAYWQILDSFKEKNITLLRGVTSSGKTEIYMNLINEMLRQKKQVLYLVPEIALTTQLTQRLQSVFGERLLIYHSKFSDNERVDIWKRLLKSDDPCIVVGVRSSVFLPFGNLGLVIVDEEHEPSYKQQDPAPRYNARNVAMILAMYHGAKTLLGSATPAIESYYNALTGKYALVELLERYEKIELPDVKLVDMKLERKKKNVTGLFSADLISTCRKSLDEGKQVILFQNRRGYAPMIECRECAAVPKCNNCDVSLTYHRHSNILTCHYCGYTIPVPNLCPTCGQPTLNIVGYGTERIEDDVVQAFPGKSILRMDLDTTRNKNGYDKIIDEFSQGKAQILVGTQMVTKGLDFGNVSVVGVLNADTMINYPDFRANERAFNMLEQVSGRAGRKGRRGEVVIQTTNPKHSLLAHVVAHDYVTYYKEELGEREMFKYPPFSKLIKIYIKHRDDATVGELSVRYSNMLREIFAHRVLGPEPPMIARVQQMYIRQIVLKMENEASMPKVKKILRSVYENMINADSRMKSAFIYYDVDPYM